MKTRADVAKKFLGVNKAKWQDMTQIKDEAEKLVRWKHVVEEK